MPEHSVYLKLDHDTLVNPGTTEVGWLGKVHWIIQDAGIESFKLVSKPGYTHNIFTSRAERDYDTTLQLTVSVLVFRNWDYAIYWKDKATNTEHRLDPKIAVKSKPGISLLIIAMPLLLAIATFRTVRYVRNMKTKKSLVQNK